MTIAKPKFDHKAFEADHEHRLRELARTAASVLLDVASTGAVNFELAGIAVSPLLLAEVGKLLREGKIKVAIDRSRSISVYNPDQDTLTFDSWDLSSPRSKAVVIHEATHAIYDLSPAKVRTIDAESAGYIAQVIYLRKNDPRFASAAKVSSDGTAEGNLKARAFAVGDSIIAGKGIRETDLKKLHQAIAPLYPGIYSTKKWTHFSGISGL